MTIERIPLRNLLRLAGAEAALETKLLRENIRADLNREANAGSGGRSFYTDFWADAKNYARGRVDLREATAIRVEANLSRRNLYPALAEGFLSWWLERRRARNEPFTEIEQSVKGVLEIEGLGTIVIDNIFALRIGDEEARIIYPYFFNEPVLTTRLAAWGLWVMSETLPNYRVEDMRILDVIRGEAYSLDNVNFEGNEQIDLVAEYRRLIGRWNQLRAEPRYN